MIEMQTMKHQLYLNLFLVFQSVILLSQQSPVKVDPISIYPVKKICDNIYKFILLLLILVLSTTGCKKDENNGYKYQLPETTDDGWETASLSSVGINTGNIEALIDKINSNEYTDFHGIVIVKDNKLVFEEYFPGYNSSGVYKDYKRVRFME